MLLVFRVDPVSDTTRALERIPGLNASCSINSYIARGLTSSQFLSYDTSHSFNSRQCRIGTIFRFPVKYCLTVYYDSEVTTITWRKFQCHIFTSFCKKLGGHPGRLAEVRSRNTVEYLNYYFSFHIHWNTSWYDRLTAHWTLSVIRCNPLVNSLRGVWGDSTIGV